MPRISDITVIHLPVRPAIRISADPGGKEENFPGVIAGGFSRLGKYLAEVGGEIADVPFVMFQGTCPSDFILSVCFPLHAAVPGRDEISAAPLPAERVAFCMYLGAYENMLPVQEEMFAWFAENGHARPTVGYETYYNDPMYPVDQLLTRIAMPLP